MPRKSDGTFELPPNDGSAPPDGGVEAAQAAQAAQAAEAAPKAKRVVGPKNVYFIFKPGTDAAFVEQVKAQVGEVTMNTRTLVKALTGGSLAPFLQYQVQVGSQPDKSE